jgi:hypothetical protein
MPTPAPALRFLALLATGPAALAAQENLYSQAAVVGGIETRHYSYGDKLAVGKVSQVVIPVGLVAPVGKRFSFDLGTSFASTTYTDTSGAGSSFSHITDTQIRGSYILGNDVLVASVMVNLPTGAKTTTLQNFSVGASAASNFLLFPVNSYGTGFSVTPGLAVAATAGDWNLGLAGSVRVSSEYAPFSSNPTRYKPGVESRIRAGIDRLVGSSRASLGMTFSTFGQDQLSGTSGGSTYDPGNRLLIDAAVVSPLGKGTLNVYLWNYHRSNAGGSAGRTNHENIFTAGASGSFPLSHKLTLEPLLEARLWNPDPAAGKGSLFGAGTALRIALNRSLALVPGGRFDFGRLRNSNRVSDSITGWDLSALLRYGF